MNGMRAAAKSRTCSSIPWRPSGATMPSAMSSTSAIRFSCASIHRAGMERRDLVVVEVGDDERLRGVRSRDRAHAVDADTERGQPPRIRRLSSSPMVAMTTGSPPSALRLYAMLPAHPPHSRRMSPIRKDTESTCVWSGRMWREKRSLNTMIVSCASEPQMRVRGATLSVRDPRGRAPKACDYATASRPISRTMYCCRRETGNASVTPRSSTSQCASPSEVTRRSKPRIASRATRQLR